MFGITSRKMLCRKKISDDAMIEINLFMFDRENVVMQQIQGEWIYPILGADVSFPCHRAIKL